MMRETVGSVAHHADSAGTPARASLRANLLLLALSLLVTFALLEVAARMVMPAPLAWRYPQLRYRADADLVFALQPDQDAFTADKAVHINERGLRGTVVPYETPPGATRVLFLGDSITFGYGVHDDETVAARVATLLGESGIAADVVNTGVPSYNLTQEVAYLEREGLRYHPDWVVVGICWNDINDKSEVVVSPDGWLMDAGTPVRPDAPISAQPAGYAIRNFVKSSRAIYGITRGWRALRAGDVVDEHTQFRTDVLEGRDSPKVARGWTQLDRGVERLATLARERGFRVLVVAFPLPLALQAEFPESSYPRRLAEIAQARGVPFLDLDPAFRRAYQGHDSLFIPYDGDHPNAAGHALAADEIARRLVAAMRGGTMPPGAPPA